MLWPMDRGDPPRVKMCGFTRAEDVAVALDLGVDAIGLVCYPPSPRYVPPERLSELAAMAAGRACVMLVVVDPGVEFMKSLFRAAPGSFAQFHGNESVDFCLLWGRPFVKTVRLTDQASAHAAQRAWPRAGALLADSVSPGWGGSGRSFDWNALKGVGEWLEPPLILSGGLCPDNVRQAVDTLRPRGVDVSSGIESAPGIKDWRLMRRFMKALGRDA